MCGLYSVLEPFRVERGVGQCSMLEPFRVDRGVPVYAPCLSHSELTEVCQPMFRDGAIQG